MTELKIYDISNDDMREPTQADIDHMKSYEEQFGALKRITKLLGNARWDQYRSIEDAILKVVS